MLLALAICRRAAAPLRLKLVRFTYCSCRGLYATHGVFVGRDFRGLLVLVGMAVQGLRKGAAVVVVPL